MLTDDMSAHKLAKILIIEDDPQQIRLYSKALRGYRLTCVSRASAALQEIAKQIPDVIILDNVLAGGEIGSEFLPRLKEVVAHVPVIVISGTLDIKGKLKTLQGPHAAHYLIEKPVDLDELEATVKVALEECGLAQTVRSLQSLERAEMVESNEPERRFTERLARQSELLNRLRGSTERPNISRLAAEFNVSRKTINRDLQDLIQRRQLEASVYPEWNSPAQ